MTKSSSLSRSLEASVLPRADLGFGLSNDLSVSSLLWGPRNHLLANENDRTSRSALSICLLSGFSSLSPVYTEEEKVTADLGRPLAGEISSRFVLKCSLQELLELLPGKESCFQSGWPGHVRCRAQAASIWGKLPWHSSGLKAACG